MSRLGLFLTLILVLLLPMASLGQVTVLTPEHVTYDVANDRYIVCSWQSPGKVVTIDQEGVIDDDFITGIGNAYANHIVGDTLYVTAGQFYLRAYDLATGTQFYGKNILGSRQLDGIAADNSGHLYIVDAALPGKIFKFTISNQTYTELVNSGLPDYPQDIFYDAANDRLLLASYDYHAPLLAIDPNDGSLTTLVTTPFGNSDGVAIDNDGRVYMTCYTGGTIHRYDDTFTNPAKLVSSGHQGPAGIGYNPVENILAIPNFIGNRIDFIPLDDADGDDVYDYIDNCPDDPNPDQLDSDGDGDGNVCDGCPYDYNPGHEDTDMDTIEDACDNCPDHYNPGQEDGNENDIGDVCDYICADADGDRTINILDIVYLINFLYKSGPTPEPLESADINHDLAVNILDIVYLINFIYKNGPEPECTVWPVRG